MKQDNLMLLIALVVTVAAASIVVKTSTSRPPHRGSRAFEAIQQHAQETKEAHEEEREAKQRSGGQPAAEDQPDPLDNQPAPLGQPAP